LVLFHQGKQCETKISSPLHTTLTSYLILSLKFSAANMCHKWALVAAQNFNSQLFQHWFSALSHIQRIPLKKIECSFEENRMFLFFANKKIDSW
jgi:hypothetical protein